NATRLPRGVRIVPIHDRTELVNNTFHTVARTLAEGLVIVTTVLLLFLVQIRAALLTALTIPLSLLFAFAAMYYVGVPASLLSLGALDFGIIVDGTLIMVEHILRRLPRREEHPSEAAVWRAVAAAGTEVARPIFFSLVIIVCAFIPLLT